jgi:hypothetical protein
MEIVVDTTKAVAKKSQNKAVKVMSTKIDSNQALRALKNGGILTQYDFKSPEIIESAYTSLLAMVRGERFGDIEKITDKTVLKATKMIIDRIMPIVKTSVTETTTQEHEDDIDLDKFAG